MNVIEVFMIAAILSTNFMCGGGYGLEYFTVEQIMKDNLMINAPGIYYPDVDIGPDGVFVDYECRSVDILDMADDIGPSRPHRAILRSCQRNLCRCNSPSWRPSNKRGRGRRPRFEG